MPYGFVAAARVISVGSSPNARLAPGHLVRPCDVDGPEGVLVELGHLGRLARRHEVHARRHGADDRGRLARAPLGDAADDTRHVALVPVAVARVDALRREGDEHLAARRAGRARRAAAPAAPACSPRRWCWSARSPGRGARARRRSRRPPAAAAGPARCGRPPASGRRSRLRPRPASAPGLDVSMSSFSSSADCRRSLSPAARSTLPSRMSCSRRSLTSTPVTFAPPCARPIPVGSPT